MFCSRDKNKCSEGLNEQTLTAAEEPRNGRADKEDTSQDQPNLLYYITYYIIIKPVLFPYLFSSLKKSIRQNQIGKLSVKML